MTTFQAVAVTLLAVLPGASYTFAFERVAGSFRVSLSDRLVRFAAASAAFHAFFSAPELLLYRELVVSGRVQRAEIAAWQFELLAVAYVFLPTAAGSLVGHGRNKRWRWVTWLTGASPEPRAWDYLWTQPNRTLIVRLRLKSGRWVAGFFGNVEGAPTSYAAGYPEAQDLFLGLQVKVEPETGEFIEDEEGRIQPVEGRTSFARTLGRGRVRRCVGGLMAVPAHEGARAAKAVTGSGFEKKGGYPATGPVVSVMPKAPAGPAPGSGSQRPGGSGSSARKE